KERSTYMQGDISILIAFTAGTLSFFSPCVLPLIPSYITFLIGDYSKQKEYTKAELIIPASIFILGFTSIFVLLGLSASYLGKLLLQNQAIFRKIGGIFVIILGLHVSGIFKIKALYQQKNFEIPQNINKYLRSFIMGIALAFAWTPCVGPILSSILIYAGSSQSMATGGFLLLFYSIGFALPFMAVALFMNWFLPKFKKINPYLPIIEKVTGILIIIVGILIYTNNLVFTI
ncbi:MAG TPA: cytochrome c biogenesis CcdA family protein, partial [Halanaerobiales bacterium]|nr:cytochrome c biogenesis CcdA family protein [Halanaerobiales bacterium]